VKSEQSLFCSKNPAGGAARKRVRYFSREPRVAWAGERESEERKERLPCFHTAFLKPGTLVTECFDWSVYDPMARICHHHLETFSARQRLPSIKLLTATGWTASSLSFAQKSVLDERQSHERSLQQEETYQAPRHQTHSFKRSYSHILLKPSSAIYYRM